MPRKTNQPTEPDWEIRNVTIKGENMRWIITIEGRGFNNNDSVHIGGLVPNISTRSDTTIVCVVDGPKLQRQNKYEIQIMRTVRVVLTTKHFALNYTLTVPK